MAGAPVLGPTLPVLLARFASPERAEHRPQPVDAKQATIVAAAQPCLVFMEPILYQSVVVVVAMLRDEYRNPERCRDVVRSGGSGGMIVLPLQDRGSCLRPLVKA